MTGTGWVVFRGDFAGGGRRKSEEDVGWRRQSKVRSLCRWEP